MGGLMYLEQGGQGKSEAEEGASHVADRGSSTLKSPDVTPAW